MSAATLQQKRAFYSAVWDILVEVADALPRDRWVFVTYLCDGASWHEYRFCGSLGFGGKLHESGGQLRVGYYPEDATAKREQCRADCQRRIDELVAEWTAKGGAP